MSERQRAAETLAEKLFEAEAAIDDAIAKTGELYALLPALRREINLSAVVGQDVFSATGDAAARLGQARGDMVRTHNALDQVRRALRLDRVRAGGPIEKGGGEYTPMGRMTVVGGSEAA